MYYFFTFSNFYLRSDASDGKVTMEFFACNFLENMIFSHLKPALNLENFSSVSQKMNRENSRKKSGHLNLTRTT